MSSARQRRPRIETTPGRGLGLDDGGSRYTGLRPALDQRPRWARLAIAAGVSLSAFFLFGLQLHAVGIPLLAVSLIAAMLLDRELGKDLALVAVGVGIVSTTSSAIEAFVVSAVCARAAAAA